jgi:hypothetical protein
MRPGDDLDDEEIEAGRRVDHPGKRDEGWTTVHRRPT